MTDTLRMASIDADSIVAGSNDRKQFDPGELEALAVSIARDGLAQPPTVRPLADGRFEIVAGERRVRAMRDVLGWNVVPVLVRAMTDDEASATMLVENMVRVNLDAVEEAKAYSARLAAGATVGDLAELVGVSQRTVRARVDLLRLCDDALALVSSGSLALGHAGQLVGLDGDRQNLALRALQSADLTLGAFTSICDRLRSEQESEPLFSADLFWSVEEYVVHGREDDRHAKLLSMGEQMLSTREAAALAGITPRSLRTLVARGTFPPADGRFDGKPWWKPETVARWLETKRSPGRPRKIVEDTDPTA